MNKSRGQKKKISIKSRPKVYPDKSVRGKLCTAIIGDLVSSRELGLQRAAAQEGLAQILKYFNKKYRRAILSKFTITLGDEFQGLLKKADIIPDIIWELETFFQYTEVRVGIGHGEINTPWQQVSLGMDGPAWYAARDAITIASNNKQLGGVFNKFNELDDKVLNGIARLLHHQRSRLTPKQREVIGLLRQGLSQVEIANQLAITKQAVYQHAKYGGWSAFNEGEASWRAVLGKYDFTDDWAN